MKRTALLGILLAGLVTLAGALRSLGSPVINEVAWAGTQASSSDEWIELHNPTDEDIELTGWTLVLGEAVIHLGEVSGNTKELRTTVIPAGGFFLLERTDDETVSDIVADLIYSGSLRNDGVALLLVDSQGQTVDSLNPDGGVWPAGSSSAGEPPWASMERIDAAQGAGPGNWASNDGVRRTGLDADGVPLNGTPRGENSAAIAARTTPKVTLIHPDEEQLALSGVVVITWQASDPDGEATSLRVDLWLRTPDETWLTLAEGLANGGAYTWDSSSVADGSGYCVRVVVTDADGLTARDEGESFSVTNGG
ncbi:MAG: lamin tail domain-containing protein [Candidatus Bipolaricaulota bacterium]|nr:MAG: lamin tail domain-containing protein [Candidatus Bipolaricaulota bacterium]